MHVKKHISVFCIELSRLGEQCKLSMNENYKNVTECKYRFLLFHKWTQGIIWIQGY